MGEYISKEKEIIAEFEEKYSKINNAFSRVKELEAAVASEKKKYDELLKKYNELDTQSDKLHEELGVQRDQIYATYAKCGFAAASVVEAYFQKLHDQLEIHGRCLSLSDELFEQINKLNLLSQKLIAAKGYLIRHWKE